MKASYLLGGGRALSNYDPTVYDDAYYQGHCGTPYDRDYNNGMWLRFFSLIAKAIVNEYHPVRFLDVGCAKGFLVECLQDMGVDAYGFDISSVALGAVRDDVKSRCKVGSSNDGNSYDGHFDVIACIEVVEHLTPQMGEETIRLLCEHGDVIVFSSSPDDLSEPTHINVQPGRYWEALFRKFGFEPSPGDCWSSKTIAPHAQVFKHRWMVRIEETLASSAVIEKSVQAAGVDYRTLLNITTQLTFLSQHASTELRSLKSSLQACESEIRELRAKIDGLELRNTADSRGADSSLNE